MIINDKHLSFYKINGFLKVSNFFTSTELNQLKKYVLEINNLEPKIGKEMIYFDKKKKKIFLTRTENFIKFHKNFKKFLKKKKLVNLIDKILGKKSILFKDKINWKYPGADGFEPHQDAQVWEYLYPKIKSFVSLSISINETNIKNGCLKVVRKKHTNGLLGDNKSSINEKIVKQFKWENILTKPGDIVFFDSYTPHMSGPNRSKKSRKIIYLTYNAKKDGNLKEAYFNNKRKSFPPNIERIKGKNYKYLI
jgi:2-aminoethylphosphonate dioxygenase